MQTQILAVTTLALSLMALPAAAGGRPIPIVDPVDAPVVWPGGTPGDVNIVKRAILAGLLIKGWTGEAVAPSVIHAVLQRPDFRAKIDISYNATSYTVKYAASEHLDYDADKRLIHRNYNHWIELLRRAIDIEMAVLSKT